MDAKDVRNMKSILVVFNKHNTARVASCWFTIYYMQGISWLAENRLASQEGLCSVDYGVSLFIERIIRKQIYTLWAKCAVLDVAAAGTYPRPTKCLPFFRCLLIGLFWVKYVLTAFPCITISVLRYGLFCGTVCFCTIIRSCLVLALKILTETESLYFHFLSPSLPHITQLINSVQRETSARIM